MPHSDGLHHRSHRRFQSRVPPSLRCRKQGIPPANQKIRQPPNRRTRLPTRRLATPTRILRTPQKSRSLQTNDTTTKTRQKYASKKHPNSTQILPKSTRNSSPNHQKWLPKPPQDQPITPKKHHSAKCPLISSKREAKSARERGPKWIPKSSKTVKKCSQKHLATHLRNISKNH